jgi:hypothetical protein
MDGDSIDTRGREGSGSEDSYTGLASIRSADTQQKITELRNAAVRQSSQESGPDGGSPRRAVRQTRKVDGGSRRNTQISTPDDSRVGYDDTDVGPAVIDDKRRDRTVDNGSQRDDTSSSRPRDDSGGSRGRKWRGVVPELNEVKSIVQTAIHKDGPKQKKEPEKALSATEAKSMGGMLEEIFRDMFQGIDGIISRTNKERSEACIWAVIEDDEVAILVKFVLRYAQRYAAVAVAVRAAKSNWETYKVGMIIGPKLIETAQFYKDHGGIA